MCVTDWRRNTEMGQYQIRITKQAEADLGKAGDYIAYELKNSSAVDSKAWLYRTFGL